MKKNELTRSKKLLNAFALSAVFTVSGMLSAISPEAYAGRNGNNESNECSHRAARGIVSTVSNYDFATTLENVHAQIDLRPLGVFIEIDHQANSEAVGIEFPPTTVIIFGNPAIGGQVMEINQAIGLDLPLKMLVWEDSCGVVRVDYTDPNVMQARFGVNGDVADTVFDTMAGALDGIATGATQ